MNYKEFFKWYVEYFGRGEGRKFLDKLKAEIGIFSHTISIDGKGRFELPGVAPGEYVLRGVVQGRTDPNDTNSPIDEKKVLSHVAVKLTVPQIENPEQRDVAIDFGVVQCDKAPLKVGDQAPDFEIERLKADGKIRLSEYRGKTVLLNFTSLLIDASPPEGTGDLKTVCEQLKLRNDITVINVTTERTSWDVMRQKMIQESNLPGVYGVIQYYTSKTFVDYELKKFTESVLIAADGKILWKGAPGDELLEVVAGLR
jgi:hypothetical protein